MKPLYSISDLCREFGVSTRTLRFYETEGLLSPLRRGRTRFYRSSDRTRLKLILRGKRLGLRLAEIREIIDLYRAPPGETGQLGLLLDRIAHRRAELLQKQRDIEETLAELDTVEAGCRARLAALGGETLPGNGAGNGRSTRNARK